MVKRFAHSITELLIKNNTIKNDEYDLYKYGFETIIANTINLFVILSVGAILGVFLQTLLFLLCYCPTRQFSGGYHADNYKRCLLAFMSIYLLNHVMINFISYNMPNIVVILIAIICGIGVYIMSPNEHRNNPLSIKERKYYKKVVGLLISTIIVFVTLGFNFKPLYLYVLYAASSIVVVFIMLILAIIKNLRRKTNEKNT